MSSSTPNSNVSAFPANQANQANQADPANVSLARSAVTGALTGAAAGTYRAVVNVKGIIQKENERRALASERPLTEDEELALIGEATVVEIAGGVAGGVAGGLVAAANVNAYNRAMKHDKGGKGAKSWLRRAAESTGAAIAGQTLGKYVAKKTLDALHIDENPNSVHARDPNSDIPHDSPMTNGRLYARVESARRMGFGTRRYV